MTQDEIYEMVEQSDLGFLLGDNWMMQHELKAFAKLVAAKEREKFCALLRQFHDSISLTSNSNITKGEKA
jgi:hypothetical protein